MDRKRSTGVTFFGYLGIFIAISDITAMLLKMTGLDWMKIIGVFIVIFLFFNLLKLKNWARITLVILNTIVAILLFVFDLYIVFSFSLNKLLARMMGKLTPLGIITVIIFSILLHINFFGLPIYLTRPKVKEQFR